MFSFCDSIRAKSVVGVAGGGEEGRVAVIGEKREAIVTCGRSQKREPVTLICLVTGSNLSYDVSIAYHETCRIQSLKSHGRTHLTSCGPTEDGPASCLFPNPASSTP